MAKTYIAALLVMMVMATASMTLVGCTSVSGGSSESTVTLKGG